MKALVLFLSCCYAASGCSARGRPAAAPLEACAALDSVPVQWQEVRTPYFTFRVPAPVTQRTRSMGDAVAYEYRGGGITVIYELSEYAGAGPGPDENKVGFTHCEVTVDGRAVRVVSYWDERPRAYVVYSFWPGFPPGPSGEIRLAFMVQSRYAERRADLVRVIHSVRFANPAGNRPAQPTPQP